MNCTDVSTLVPLHLTGEPDRPRARELQDHLRDCPSCNAELGQQAAFDALLRDSVLAEPINSAPLERRLQNFIARESQRIWRHWMYAAAAVAAAARNHRYEIVDRQPRKWLADQVPIEDLAAAKEGSSASPGNFSVFVQRFEGRDRKAGQIRTRASSPWQNSHDSQTADESACPTTNYQQLTDMLWQAFSPIPLTFPKAQAFCGVGDLVAGVSAFENKEPRRRQRPPALHAGFRLEKSKWYWAFSLPGLVPRAASGAEHVAAFEHAELSAPIVSEESDSTALRLARFAADAL
jgi:hypothetical protein